MSTSPPLLRRSTLRHHAPAASAAPVRLLPRLGFTCSGLCSFQHVLNLHLSAVANEKVKTLSVKEHLYSVHDVQPGLLPCFVASLVNPLYVQRLEELSIAACPMHRHGAHGNLHAEIGSKATIGAAGVLYCPGHYAGSNITMPEPDRHQLGVRPIIGAIITFHRATGQ